MKIRTIEFTRLTENGELIGEDAEITGIATDSGNVKSGDLFICIKGERTDGHKYVADAERNGAVCILSDRDIGVSIPYIKVPNTVKSLQTAALNYRKTLSAKIVGVTGSVGKTTTKELIFSVISQEFPASKTDGNKNSETGVPITLFGIKTSDKAAVVEMGMSDRGEISALTKLALPDIGVITNVGYSHIEHLKTRENILRAKLEILDGMNEKSVLIINSDDDMLKNCRSVHKNVLTYGISENGSDYFAYNIKERETSVSFTAKTPENELSVILNIPGRHNVLNSLAAIAVGETLGISSEKIIKGLSEYRAEASRQNIYTINGVTVYDDCYNSAPNSLEASLDVLKGFGGRKIAVLGDMLELGEDSASLHRIAGKALGGIDKIYLYGSYAKYFAEGAVMSGVKADNIFIFSDAESLAAELIKKTEKDDVILFKASRGMHAEKIIAEFSENYR